MHVLRYPFALVRDALEGELTMRAMSLVYTTILSLVPLIALSLSILKAFEFHYEVEPLLNNVLAPLGPRAPEITNNIIQFVDNVRGTALGSAGLAMLIFTVISMVHKVEESFNFVWQVSKSRSLVRRFSEYFSFIVAAPVLMLFALGLFGTLSFDAISDRLLQYDWLADSTRWLRSWLPLLFIAAAFSFIYGFIPNTKVHWRAAVVGGVIGALLWISAGELFSAIVATSSQYTAIYSTFAILIIALIWLYLGWLILLIGAKVSFYTQNPQYLRHGRQRLTLNNARREELALGLMHNVALKFQSSEGKTTLDSLAQQLGVTGNLLAPLATLLEDDGLLTRSEHGTLLPARALDQISIQDVFAAVRADTGAKTDHVNRELTAPIVTKTLDQVDTAIAQTLGNTTLNDLIQSEISTTDDLCPTDEGTNDKPV